jgi:DNA-binding transcriptional ArsR family regulator
MDYSRVKGEDGRLAERLAADLDPALRDALDSPLRRDILRALEARDGIGGAQELSAALPGRTMSTISYHLQVLERAGAVSDGSAFVAAEGRRLYRSEVDGDRQVRSVLRATERWDRRRQPDPGPAGAMAMFRLPRPGPTLRLHRRREERPGAGR